MYLHGDNYVPGKVHSLFGLDFSARESERLKPKIRLATGTYILQTNRKSFNQHIVSDTCLLCSSASESTEHFVLVCPMLDSIRAPIIGDLEKELSNLFNIDNDQLSLSVKTQYIINCWPFAQQCTRFPVDLLEYERQCSRLLYNLDRARIRMLNQVVSRRRKPRGPAHITLPDCPPPLP